MASPFASLAIDTEATARFRPIHPHTGKPLADEAGEEAWIDFLGWHSQVAQTHRLSRETRLRRERRDNTTAEEDWNDMGEMLARLTKNWHLVGLDGRHIDVPCSYDLAVEAYNALALRWMRMQALEFLNVQGNFAAPSSTSS